MERSLKDILKHLLVYIPDDLLSQKWYNPILYIADKFLPGITSKIGFETVLTSSEPKTDLLIQIANSTQWKIFTELLYENRNNTLFKASTWKALQNFTQVYTSNNRQLASLLDSMWLEFDVHSYEDKPVIPFIYFHFADSVSKKGDTNDYGTVFDTLSLFNKKTYSLKVWKNIEHCLSLLFNEMVLNYYGIMPSRNPEVVRICIKGVIKNELFQFLVNIFSMDDLEEFRQLISPFVNSFNKFWLHLNISEIINPIIGIELYPDEEDIDIMVYQEIWKKKFEAINSNKNIVRKKLEGLLGFIGTSREIFIPEISSAVTFRYFNHFKIVYKPSDPITIKGYFGFKFIPIS